MTPRLIVHGDTEFYCLPRILSEFGIQYYGHPFNLRGKGFSENVSDIVKEDLLFAVETVSRTRPDKILIVTDKENRQLCPGQYASMILNDLKKKLKRRVGTRHYKLIPCISVVVADSMYENWILADPDGISSLKSLVKRNPKNAIKGQADTKNAIRILNDCLIKEYTKPYDSIELTKRVRFKNIEVQSRSKSLKKFLKETSCIKY
jgi:hypothetical protein